MSRTTKAASAASFLQNMKRGADAAVPAAVEPESSTTAKSASRPKATGRAGLKHIGGYFSPETVERVAVLRARLDLDNSELIKLAIDELYSREKAKRAFND
ncbi:ribbon-helix-helix domain-containing protein [Caballeronia grimmiae]|uniref:ribbon-helix-helix domain-containing protein n=1 Tax=Caballeronia grimmiae TaxID=1071679 RepID=UPI0038BCAFD0